MATSFKKVLLFWAPLLFGVISSGVEAQVRVYDFAKLEKIEKSDPSPESKYAREKMDYKARAEAELKREAAAKEGERRGYDFAKLERTDKPDQRHDHGRGEMGGRGEADSGGSHWGGAPEIDGSLAPKVGFLLGCLFLMFGRRNKTSDHSEPLSISRNRTS